MRTWSCNKQKCFYILFVTTSNTHIKCFKCYKIGKPKNYLMNINKQHNALGNDVSRILWNYILYCGLFFIEEHCGQTDRRKYYFGGGNSSPSVLLLYRRMLSCFVFETMQKQCVKYRLTLHENNAFSIWSKWKKNF